MLFAVKLVFGRLRYTPEEIRRVPAEKKPEPYNTFSQAENRKQNADGRAELPSCICKVTQFAVKVVDTPIVKYS